MHLCGLEVRFAEMLLSFEPQKKNTMGYCWLLDAFLSLLEMDLGFVGVQVMGLWGATGYDILAEIGTFLCPMVFFC